MVFILIYLIFSLILFIVIFGNVNERELNKHKEDWKRIMGEPYK